MIAPDLKPRNGSPQRPPTAVPPAFAPGMSPSSLPGGCPSGQFSAAVAAIRSVVGGVSGAGGRYPLAVLMTTAAAVGVTAGWWMKRR